MRLHVVTKCIDSAYQLNTVNKFTCREEYPITMYTIHWFDIVNPRLVLS